ncbi:MAG TPA: YkvA family protein [Trichocoleus sp.]
MKNLAQAFYSWYKQALHHPKYRWFLVGGTLLYLLSPIDISPDFIPIIGWIDDSVVATLLVAELAEMLRSALNSRERQDGDTASVEGETTVIDVEPQ